MPWPTEALSGALLAVLVTTPVATGDASADDSCTVRSWEVQWGVKESFRSYLSGSIANGEWTTDGEVSYQTPLFTLSGTEGIVGADFSSGELSTVGSIRFVGHGGILDQTLSTPRVVFDSPESAHLVFDVYGATQEGVFVDRQAVKFVEVDISQATVDSDAGVFEVSGAPAVFTTEGAEAFGTYPAGEEFDPVSLRFSTEPGCLAGPQPVSVMAIGGAILALALAVVAIVWARKSRGPGRLEPTES